MTSIETPLATTITACVVDVPTMAGCSACSDSQSLTNSNHPFATKTVFPDFGIPDLLDITDTSSNSSSSGTIDDEDARNTSDDGDVNVITPEEELNAKPDRDVVVFMALAERMSLQSLVHILQGHVRHQMPGEWGLLVAAANASNPLNSGASVSSSNTATKRNASTITTCQAGLVDGSGGLPCASPRPKKKAFRFAELRGGMVRQVVHEIEDWKHVRELWWSEQEMMDMRVRAIATVKHYRKHRPSFMAAVETVMKLSSSSDDVPTDNESNSGNGGYDAVVENAMKQLCQESCLTRGLETHICVSLSRARSATIQAVLDEQQECRSCDDSLEVTMEALRGQSLAYSRASRHFARKLGQADYVEALKATLSTWEPLSAVTTVDR